MQLGKKKHFFYGIFNNGGDLPLFHNFVLEKKHFFKIILKEAQKLLIHPEM
jgi:hypothetical protein